MYIQKLDVKVDLDKVKKDLEDILKITSWGLNNQIGIKHRPFSENIWYDAVGSIYDRETKEKLADELDFSVWNFEFPTYTQTIIESLEKTFAFRSGRIRFMRLMPKNGLSIHVDAEDRIHLVLETNPTAMVGFGVEGRTEIARCYHIPADEHFYHIKTTLPHFVYNAGSEPRIHLVISKC